MKEFINILKEGVSVVYNGVEITEEMCDKLMNTHDSLNEENQKKFFELSETNIKDLINFCNEVE